tara:strand:+ start:279 stop:737 length:459 start_codon:yes stop_codon:yes gene_type:complete
MKLITPLLIFMLAFPVSVFANDLKPLPQVTGVEKGETVPFSGVLLNPTAAAKIFAEKNFSDPECQLKIDFELDKLKASHALQVKSLQLSLDMADKKYNSVLTIKDEEIERLTKIAIDNDDRNYSKWWAIGGVVVGVVLTVGMFYVTAEVSNR